LDASEKGLTEVSNIVKEYILVIREGKGRVE
jgi:hypothetical protein